MRNQSLILQMIALNPSERPAFADVLDSARDVVFPDSFYSFLHSYITSINETSSPSLFTRSGTQTGRSGATGPAGPSNTPHPGGAVGSGNGPDSWSTLPSDSDHRIERIWGEFDSIEPVLLAEGGERVEDTVTALPSPPPKAGLASKPIKVSLKSVLSR